MTRAVSLSRSFFLFGLFSSFFSCAAVDQLQLDLLEQVNSQLAQLSETVGQLHSKVDDGLMKTSDKVAFQDQLSSLDCAVDSVVQSMQGRDDYAALKFLCAFSCVAIESFDWLLKTGDPTRGSLDLASIRVADFPEDINQLAEIIQANEQECTRLASLVAQLKPGWFARAWGACTSAVGTVLNNTLGSKWFAGMGASAIAAYLLYRFSKKKEPNDLQMSYRSFSIRSRNKVGGVVVTANNFYSLAPKAPTRLAKKLLRWFQDNKDAKPVLVEQNGPFLYAIYKEQMGHGLLKEKGIESLSPWSFVFELPTDPEWIVKISGSRLRANLQIANQNLPYGHIQEADPRNLVPTHQTSSRVFHGAMKLREAKRVLRLSEIEVVEAYLWSPSESCEDKACVVVERTLRNHKLLCHCSDDELDHILTQERIVQLMRATKHAGLWNITGDNVAVNCSNNKLVIVDTEQPDTTKPSQAFNRDVERYKFNVNSGVKEFYKFLFSRNVQARDHVEAWARNDRDVMSANNSGELLSLFEVSRASRQE